jgi:type VI secretion system protein ImpM
MDGELPGWHGKLPSLGDFASRRLPPDFIEVWDTWLAAGLAALKKASPESWLEAYLASPSWRFLLAPRALPGPCGAQCWAGVLMPSVDRAGRYFPFSVVVTLPQLPRTPDAFSQLHRWLHRIDDLAADALQDDWTVAQLEAELARVRPPPAPGVSARASTVLVAHGGSATFMLASAADVTALLTEDALAIWQTAASGQAFWWCEPDADPGRLVVTRGLPAGAAVGVLLGAAGHVRDGSTGPLSSSAPAAG